MLYVNYVFTLIQNAVVPVIDNVQQSTSTETEHQTTTYEASYAMIDMLPTEGKSEDKEVHMY